MRNLDFKTKIFIVSGTGDAAKTDEFLETFHRGRGGGGGGIFNPQIYVADFGPLNRAFTRFFGRKLEHNFTKMRGSNAV